MTDLAIIGGSGLSRLAAFQSERQWSVSTPYGEPSGPLSLGQVEGVRVLFLPRHGPGHSLPPHAINYRANLWALREAGARRVLAVAAVGGITPNFPPRRLAVPDQIIDYTWGRAHTFFDAPPAPVSHVDWTQPYSEGLREALLRAGARLGLDVHDGGTYGATQGPRLESAAEINRLARDGCDMVGMTGMPEAGLARELELEYAHCAVVANWAAGRAPGPISMAEVDEHLGAATAEVVRLLGACLRLLSEP